MFTKDDLRSFMEMGRVVEYAPGEMIIKKGDLDCWVYFLLSGELQVSNGMNVIRTLSKRGEVFGEMAVIDGSARSTNVSAIKKSIVLGVDASLMDSNNDANGVVFNCTLYRVFSEILAERLRELTEENTSLKADLARFKSRIM